MEPRQDLQPHLWTADPSQRRESTASMPMSPPLPDHISQAVSPIDGNSTAESPIVPSITKQNTELEDHDEEPDWKITIENTDGSTSEVNLRRKQIRISMIAEKPKDPEKPAVTVTEKEVTESAPVAEKVDPSKDIDPRKQRIWIFGQHALTAASSIIIIAIMIVTLVAFRNNANVDGAFAKNTILSPTIVMLSIACLNVAADVVTLGIHFCHGRHAALAGRMVHRIRSVLSIIQAIGGATSAGYFKTAESLSGGSDIWGFCCSDAATVKFANMLCQSSRAAFGLNILQVILHGLSFAMGIWTLFKPGQDTKTIIEEAKHLLGQDDVEDKKDGNVA